MRQLYLKFIAAIRFWKLSWHIIKINFFERLNIFLIEKKLRKKPLTTPLSIVMRVTEKCFLKCKMCGQNGESGRLKDVKTLCRERISDQIYDDLYNDIKNWKIKPLMKFTGGEPLLEWRVLKPFIKNIHSIGGLIKLNSNGVMLKDIALAEDVVLSGIEYLSISIDGDKDTHNEIRGVPTAFADAKKGVENIIAMKKKHKKTYPMILISCVVSTWNENNIDSLIDISKAWKVDWINIQFLNYITPKRSAAAHQMAKSNFGIEDQPWKGFEIPQQTNINEKKLTATIKKIMKNASCPVSTMKIGGINEENVRKYHKTDLPIKHHICHMPYVTAFVIPPHNSVFCIDYPWYGYGDLAKSTIKQAWFGEQAQKFRNTHLCYFKENGQTFPQCQRCNWPYNT
ncbi:MAG: 4Fe-4S cluster-binding domain-containing protein [Gammaproteobacteria bacterium]|jgi:sulfatase maturation enzyme AslB (radical SAM superfamily)